MRFALLLTLLICLPGCATSHDVLRQGESEELRQAALDQQQRARNAVQQAQARADEVAARVAGLEAVVEALLAG